MHSSTVIKCFAVSVRKFRHGLKISQEELAERADLHRTYIADVERGARNPTLLTIKRWPRDWEFQRQICYPKSNAIVARRINPAAPERYGSAEDNFVRAPASGKIS